MKRMFLGMSTLICAMGLMTSCERVVTPDDMAGTYVGQMDFTVDLPLLEPVSIDDVANEVTVTKAGDMAVDVAIDLDLSKYLATSLQTLVGDKLNFGTATVQCAVVSVDGEATLTGTTTLGEYTVPLTGEYENGVLELDLRLGDIVEIEFDGTRK